MTEILFVDDEASLLAGLRRMLYRMNGEWTMRFAQSGAEALEMLEERPVDVVVSDMRMPGMDGYALLRRVRDEFPSAARIVLSGYADVEQTLRTVPVAHQFLNKPCSPEVLRGAVERSLQLQRRLSNPDLRELLGSIDTLPTPSDVLLELNRMLEVDDISIETVVTLIESDVAISARVLQLANSTFFGLSEDISDIGSAVNQLGLTTVRDVLAAADLFGTVADQNDEIGYFVTNLEAHSVDVANLASLLMGDDASAARDAYTAGLLHDIGDLVLAIHRPELLLAAKESGPSEPADEIEVLGATHAEIGGYLLSMWCLPSHLVEAVTRSHDAHRLGDRTMSPVHAVYIAETLLTHRSKGLDPWSSFDESYLTELGVQPSAIQV